MVSQGGSYSSYTIENVDRGDITYYTANNGCVNVNRACICEEKVLTPAPIVYDAIVQIVHTVSEENLSVNFIVNGTFRVDWDDDSQEETYDGRQDISHLYTVPGTYTIKIYDYITSINIDNIRFSTLNPSIIILQHTTELIAFRIVLCANLISINSLLEAPNLEIIELSYTPCPFLDIYSLTKLTNIYLNTNSSIGTTFDGALLSSNNIIQLQMPNNSSLGSVINIPTTIETLILGNTGISGIFDCSGLNNLINLNLLNTGITNVINTPTTIESITLNNTNISGVFDCSGLINLTDLNLSNTTITGIINPPTTIESLTLNNTGISGAFDCSGLINLIDLNLSNTTITGIINPPTTLLSLTLFGTNISGIFDCSGLSNLTNLDLSLTGITNVINIPINIEYLDLLSCKINSANATSIGNEINDYNISTIPNKGLNLRSQSPPISPPINLSSSPWSNLIADGWTIFV
jgi:hypothetical protein